MTRVLAIIVARKPLGEGSVARNALQWGTGGLNIDACRITTRDDLNGGAYAKNPTPRAGLDIWSGNRKADSQVFKRGGAGEYQQPDGRWPANLILAHKPGCRLVGQRQVKSDGHYPSSRPAGSQVSGPSGHTGQEGLEETYTDGETVDVWECVGGCPVADLDDQSGNRPGMPIQTHRSGTSPKGYDGGWKADPDAVGYGDSGGASRFFKHVKL